MSNALGNPIFVDTASANMVWTNAIYVNAVKWVNPSGTPGQLARIEGPNGNRLWSSVSPGPYADSGPQELEIWWPRGFKVPTLEAGYLEIYHGEAR